MTQKKTIYFIAQALVSVLILAVALAACAGHNSFDEQRTDLLEDVQIEDVEQIVQIKSTEDFFAINAGFVYFGRDTCSTCSAFLPVLAEVARDKDIKVYYFNTGYFRENALLPESELRLIFDEYQVISVPLVVKIYDGQVNDTFLPGIKEDLSNVSEIKEDVSRFLTKTD